MKLLALLLISLGAFAQPAIDDGHNYLHLNSYSLQTRQALEVVLDEVECVGNEGRKLTRLLLALSDQPGEFIGRSSYGDVAIVTQTASGQILDVFACDRVADAQVEITQLTSFVLENSDNCPVNQISNGYIGLQVEGHRFDLGFAPISIEGTSRKSSVCVEKETIDISNGIRNEDVKDERLEQSTIDTVNAIIQ